MDAASYLVEAALVARLSVDEAVDRPRPRRLHVEVREGLSWMYRHAVLGPLAGATHVWFLANGIAMTGLALLVLRTLGFSSGLYGALLTVFGLATLTGAFMAPPAGRRWGSGRLVVAARALYPLGWALVAGSGWLLPAVATVTVALAVLGFAAGIENSNEMSLWQTLTPDHLMGRVNGARRSVNRTLAATGAALGGGMISLWGPHTTLSISAVAFAVAAALSLPGMAKLPDRVALADTETDTRI